MSQAKVIPLNPEAMEESVSEIQGRWALMEEGLCVVEFTRSGKVLNASRAFLDRLRFDLGEVRLQNHQIFAGTHSDSPNYGADFWEDLAMGQEKKGDYPFTSKDGECVVLRGHYRPLRDESGNVVKNILLAQDVTDLLADSPPRVSVEVAAPKDTDLDPIRSWVGSQRNVLEKAISRHGDWVSQWQASQVSDSKPRPAVEVGPLVERCRLAGESLESVDGFRLSARLDHLSLSALVEATRLGQAGEGLVILISEIRKVWEKADTGPGASLQCALEHIQAIRGGLEALASKVGNEATASPVLQNADDVVQLAEVALRLWQDLEIQILSNDSNSGKAAG